MDNDLKTPTPRTDAAELDALVLDIPGQQTTDKVVRSSIARGLEHDLADAQFRLDAAKAVREIFKNSVLAQETVGPTTTSWMSYDLFDLENAILSELGAGEL